MASTKEILARLSHEPKRSLGQNFLLDAGSVKFTIRALELSGVELVCEIGPGLGALTEHLLQLSPTPFARFVAVEKDRLLSKYLADKFKNEPGVRILEADALEWDWRELCGEHPVVLLGNLPYNISTAIIQKFGAPVSPVSRMVLTVQKEVAQRVCAKPDTPEYGSLTVVIQRFWKAEILRNLPPDVFHPRPNVDSSLIRLTRRANREIGRCDGDALERILQRGFAQRRKQLRKLLGCPLERWENVSRKIGFRPDARAQGLSVCQWQLLAAELADDVPDYTPPDSEEIFDVVDEGDRVVASLPRSEVHSRGLRHRAVHMILHNRSGEIFLQKRAPWKDINPGVWDSSAAGHMDAGESYESAAHRELMEELGVDAPLQKIGKLTPCDATGQEFIEVYLGPHEGPFKLAGLEIVGGEFFPLEQIRSWAVARPEDFSPVFLLCLPLLLGMRLSSDSGEI